MITYQIHGICNFEVFLLTYYILYYMSSNDYNTNDLSGNTNEQIRQYEPAGYLQQDLGCENTQNILLEQRSRFLKSRKIPIRFEHISPYTGNTASYLYSEGESKTPLYTQQQLDMRRKAEILQYNKNSSQSNKLTRAQRYAKIVSGPFQRKTQSVVDSSGQVTIFNLTSCETDKYVPTSTTKSNVPGKPMILQYDPNVPLYNYGENFNNSQLDEDEEEKPWNIVTSTIILLEDNISSTVFSVFIGNIDNAFTLYNVIIPISLFIEGNVDDIQNQGQETIQINAIELKILFGSSNVNASYVSNIQQLTDIQVQFNTTATNSSTNFKLTQYVGNLNINDLRLSTQYGFIYDIQLKVNVNTNTLLGQYSNVVTGGFSNISSSDYTTNQNVNIISPQPGDLSQFSLFDITD